MKAVYSSTSVADPDYFFRIRENLNYKGIFVDKGSGSGFFPDPGDPKRPDQQYLEVKQV